MSKKNYINCKKEKTELGKIISKLRDKKGLSLRQLASSMQIPPSNLTYIEKGVNAPTSQVYFNLIKILQPDEKMKRKMDILFSNIRKLPPPDVCYVFENNTDLYGIISKVGDKKLTDDELNQFRILVNSIGGRKEVLP